MEKVTTKSVSSSSTIFKSIFLKYLNRFSKGHLILKLPSGETYTAGTPESFPKAVVSINDISFFKRFIVGGDIGFAESYMDGDWSTPDLESVFLWAIANIQESGLLSGSEKKESFVNLLGVGNKVFHYLRENSLKGSKKNISYHYDLGNDFYEKWLDPSMTYSCALFEDTTTPLEEAQRNKYERIADSLDLKGGMHILEIGCGWGGFAEYIAKNYPTVKLTGITISKEQLSYAKERLKDQKQIDLIFEDYRKIDGKFDRVVSIEMIEAVGDKFLPTYFESINKLLKPSGVATIQAITSPDSRYEEFKTGTDFIQKHIFPGSLLPSIRAMVNACEKTNLHLHGLFDMGLHYAKTLRMWKESFYHSWEDIKPMGFNDIFKRKWEYYLTYCEAAFKTRNISTVQLTLIKPNNTDYKIFGA
tara:strand:- start:964 stop:2214 length:1251 start_codon:yes stop_codon:yes gene_type:complete